MKSQIKKIVSIFACICLLLSAMVITATAADSTANEIALTVDSLGLTSQSYSAATATVDGVDFEWEQLGNYGDGIQVRDSSKGTSILWNTSAFGTAIKEIKLVYSSTKDVAYSNADAEIFSFGNEVGTYTYSTKLSTTAGEKEYTITPDAETYTFFKFEHDLGYTMYWDSITIVLFDDTQSGDNTPAFDPTGKTDAEIVEAAYELTGSETIDNVSITGEITTINDPYSSSYHNITVTLAVEGTEKTMYCYRLTSAEADYETLAGLAVGDTITVEGNITVYNNSPQFAAGTMMTNCVKGEGETPVAPEDPKEIVDAAFELEVDAALPYEATLTGEVVSIDTEYSEQYGNITVTIAVEGSTETKNLVCYRLKAAEGEDASTLAVGDVITVTGNIKNYGGTVEFISGCTYVTATVEDGNDAPATDGDNTGDNTDNDNTTGGTTTGGTTTDNDNANTDNSDKSPSTGDNAGAFAVMAIAAAAVLVASKKRA